MNKNEVMAIETDSGSIQLSIDIVRNQLVNEGNVTDKEIVNFMMLCKYRKLNPFLGQAYLIKFKEKAQMVVGKDVFTERLNKNTLCEGWESGLILYDKKDKKVIERIGTFFLEDEELVGAYCTIHRNGWKNKFKWTVRLSDYFRTYWKNGKVLPMGLWATMPGIMITKCCIVAAVRNVFPEEFSGMYESSELGIEEKFLKNAVDVTPINDTKPKSKTEQKPEPKEPEPELITKDQLKLLCTSAKSTDEVIAKSYDHNVLLNYIMDKLYNSGFLKSESKKEIPKHLFDKVLAEVKKTVIKKENSWNKKNGIPTTPENEEFEDFKKLDLDGGGLPLPKDSTAKPANTKTKEKIEDKKEQIKEGSKNGKSK